MEMSSHALEQERAAGLALDVALITNITRDHLDYHGSFEEYAQAKGQLLRWPALKLAVVNADDEHCARLAVDCQRLTYSANGNSSADVWVENVKSSANGLSATVHTPWGSSALKTPLLARFNLSNLLGVITALVGMGNALSDVIDATAAFTGVPGRLQRVNNDKGFTVLVDYAHTPDALENALCALRPLTEGRLLLLFGCGGDRDRGKRPLMGEVAARLADKCVVTSDNPRSEAPQQIIDDICAGMTAADYDICVDRAEAIAAILAQAKAGDIVLLAGKGHETYQELATETIDFDDVAVAAASLQAGGVH
jgi:UDP-N-acetylmuramoyl-L-alanyl-D-glutamate--2,6-diaminopimelate ligase